MAQIDRQWPAAGRATVKDYVDHIDYAVKLIGIDHVGIASDFDGGGGVDGWNSAAESFNVTLELVRRGYTEEQIAKIWSGNLLRVWSEVEKVAAGIQRLVDELSILTSCPLRHYRRTVGHNAPQAKVECSMALHLPPVRHPPRFSGASMNRNSRLSRVYTAVLLVAALASPAAASANLSQVRIDNFGQVNDNYYRGAQPEGRDYTDLAAIGVKTLVNLTSDDADPGERAMAERAGMRYFQIPMTTHSRRHRRNSRNSCASSTIRPTSPCTCTASAAVIARAS
jgi:hypothetical protein